METTQIHEREALARILASGAFARAPNLERILVYLCEKHFQGEGHRVKEFHLATEVLGRPETFDPKKDSIVRVEIHRLRKRLKDYYLKTPNEPLRIHLPEKSYIPEFVTSDEYPRPSMPPEPEPEPQPPPAPLLAQPGASSPQPPPPSVAHPAARPSRLIPSVGIALVVLLSLWIFFKRPAQISADDRSYSAAPEPIPASPAPPAGPEVRILAGRPPGNYVDGRGHTWRGDAYYTGGEAVPVNAEIRTRGWDANIFAGMREGNFTYDIPLPAGVYELVLVFAETVYGEGRPLGVESRRVFSILANERPLVESLDVLNDAFDPNTAWTRIFKDISPAPDGKLHLKFFRSSGTKAFLNALIVRPGAPGRMRPWRMVCRSQPYRDANNVLWEPDQYFHGGTQITRPHGAPAGDHFQGERFGQFSYEIPVAKGRYAARLYFWEYWWGPNQPGRGGVGSRVFDVFSNHRPLLLDFDIIKRSPKDQTVVETFHGLEPDTRGVLSFDFVPKSNFALVNAIEILDESK